VAKTNKTAFALLGILNIEPMSGYDIRSYVQQSIGFFWQESFGQIYPSLRRLHEKKLISKKQAKQTRGPARYVYSITAKGKTTLAKWLSTEPDPELVRHELLLKLYFGDMGSPDDQIRHLEALEKQQRARLAQFEAIDRDVLPHYEQMSGHPYWRSTLRYGQHLTQARLAWCEETLAWLRNEKGNT
jgi:DNA-binding PadR family transcriptional regulator